VNPSGDGGGGNELIRRFWESVSCNVDGTIELGLESKVKLFMHLLGQATVRGRVDDRICNLVIVQDLIDFAVVNNLASFGETIISSGYVSARIRDAIEKVARGVRGVDVEELKGILINLI